MRKICVHWIASILTWIGMLWLISSAVDPVCAATASVQNVQYGRAGDHTRVIIDLDLEAQFVNERLANPERIYFDISNATLAGNFQNRTIAAGDEFLKRIRVAQNRPDVVRVVLDIAAVGEYSVSSQRDPSRIIVDLYGRPHTESQAGPVPPRPNLHEDEVKAAVIQSGAPQPPPAEAVIESSPEKETALPAAYPEPTTVARPSRPLSPVVFKPNPKREKADSEESAPSAWEMPLTMSGTISSGYYSAYTRGGGNDSQNISFVPATAAFDIHGYYRTPDLVDYSIHPEFNAGPQANDAGFQGGNGVRMSISAFRRQMFPFTFRYSNVQLKDVYFGSLSQVSSYTLSNRNKALGLTAQFQRAGLPAIVMDWGTDSVRSESFISVIPDYVSHSRHRNFNYTYQRWGWDFKGFTGRQEQTSNLFNPLAEDTNDYTLRQKVTQYQASARRSFLKDSELYVDGGSQSTSNLLLHQTVDLTARYANANLRLFQRRRWKTSLRAGYTSNIAGLLLTRYVGGLSGNGAIAPDSSVLAPFQHTTSYLNLSGLTSVDLSHGFGFYGSVDRTAVLAASESNLNSRYLTTTGGISYAGTFGWGSLSGQYGRSFGIGSVTGQAGRIEGQNYVVNVQPGKREAVQIDISIRGTQQSIFNEHPVNERGFASEGSVGFPLFGRFRARLGGGWQQNTFTNAANDFNTKGYTALAGFEHPRLQFSGSLNSMAGNSLQGYDQLFSGLGSVLLTPLHIVPSDFRGFTLNLHVIPIRKLEFSALWTHSIQHLEGVVANDFAVIDISLTYHFRKLDISGGFFSSAQDYASSFSVFPRTERGRFYIRISRTGRFL